MPWGDGKCKIYVRDFYKIYTVGNAARNTRRIFSLKENGKLIFVISMDIYVYNFW
jgi:hypothetical protein